MIGYVALVCGILGFAAILSNIWWVRSRVALLRLGLQMVQHDLHLAATEEDENRNSLDGDMKHLLAHLIDRADCLHHSNCDFVLHRLADLMIATRGDDTAMKAAVLRTVRTTEAVVQAFCKDWRVRLFRVLARVIEPFDPQPCPVSVRGIVKMKTRHRATLAASKLQEDVSALAAGLVTADADSRHGFIQTAVERTRKVFEDMTDAECSVTIKMFAGDQASDVVTMARAGETSENLKLPVAEFTPCLRIATQQTTHFVSNNLLAETDYKDATEDWPSKYRSILVTPIREPKLTAKGGWHLIGFLCISSRETEVFDMTLDTAIAEGISLAMARLLSRLAETQDATDQEQERRGA